MDESTIKLTVCGKDYDLPDNSRQSIFNHVVRFLREQGARSLAACGCAYRSVDNTHACAVGCLIDDRWTTDITNWRTAPLRNIHVVVGLMGSIHRDDIHSSFWSAIQEAHDHPEDFFNSGFETSLKRVAKQFGLEMPA